ncbi:MAG TPA: DUF962 domain-containing protein [Verrucomicrobiae bacterium]|jgi:hypothetical protein|nr:DUF962 domain-containing protein [Verrucomicrobiae bacterium]
MPFETFWPRYLNAHADPRTRAMHVAGTLAATALMVGAIAMRRPWLAAAALAAGYGPAWAAHFFIEKNRPETFKAPLQSLAADYLMTWHALSGTLDEQLATHLSSAGAE